MVKEGYKQTDIGAIPEDWDYVKLPEITSNSSTSIKIGPFGSALKKELLTKNGYKVYGQENIFEKDMNIGDRYIKQEHFNKLNSCEIKTNDFLISMMGTIGKCFIVPKQFEEGIIDSHLIRVRINENKYYLQLLVHLFGSNVILKQINQLTVGGIMDGLSSKIIKKLYIPIPPQSEQKAIAQALSDTDELITSLNKLIAKKEAIKQGTMQQLLTGKKRLAGFSGEWEEKKLGDFGVFSKGSGIKKDESNSGDIPCIRYGEIYTYHNEYIKQFKSFISKSIAKSAKQMKQGDLLFAGSGETKEDIGKCVAYVNDFDAYAGGDIVIFSPKNVDSLFLGFLLNIPAVAKQKANKGQGDAVVHISANNLSEIQIKIPINKNEQQAIAKVLSDMDDEIEKLKAKLSKTKAIKEAMMSELLTGKTRLNIPQG